ncbi:MAG: hypothetical protein HUU18_01730 [Phycisphaerales bacterium]|nr:hypothetical protein [Phycisphaerales bacterium]
MIRTAIVIIAAAISQPPATPPRWEAFAPRLEALTPGTPEAYFLLAEEIGDESSDPTLRRLAEQLFVLAFVLDRQQPGRDAIAASSCVALAHMTSGDQRRRWLYAVARKLDARQGGAAWLHQPAATTQDSAAYQVATLLGYIRAGQGAQARQMLSKPEVRAAINTYDRLLTIAGISGTLTGLERQAVSWPCNECSNQRVVRKPGGAPNEYRVCPTCDGSPGPRLSDKDLLNQLRLESWLLQGSTTSWSAQLWMDFGEPLFDPEPDDVPVAFGVDPRLVLWRDGAWHMPPESPVPPAPPKAGPQPQPQPQLNDPPEIGPEPVVPEVGGG